MKSAKKDLSKECQDAIKGKGVKVLYKEGKPKYSKQKFVKVYKAYDLLENIYTVRIFIQKKYGISHELLEILLKLMGLKMFTRKQYSEIPKTYTWSRWKSIKESGLISLVMAHPYDVEKEVYALSPKGNNIVKKFYKYLSGEEKIPESSSLNPMANKETQKSFDKKKMDLIKKLNKLEVPEHKKYLFE